MIKNLVLLILSLLIAGTALANNSPTKIFIGSDFHLFPPGFDFDTIENYEVRQTTILNARTSERSYDQMLAYIKNDPSITSVILNGDVYQAGIFSKNSSGVTIVIPVIGAFNDERRIELTIETVLDAFEKTGKEIFFNLGNHDLKAEIKNEKLVIDKEYADLFAVRFKEALDKRQRESGRRPKVHLVGANKPGYGDYFSVFDLVIGGKVIKLSHAPFVTTDAINAQAELFKNSNKRAYGKVTGHEVLKENDKGIYYIFGDTHTPAADDRLKVYNSGALASDPTVPFNVPTFMVLEGTSARHYTLDPRAYGKIVPFQIPKSVFYCGKFYK